VRLVPTKRMTGRSSVGAATVAVGLGKGDDAVRSPPRHPPRATPPSTARIAPFADKMRRGGPKLFMSILRCESLTRSYVSGGREITVLRDTTFELEPGGFLAITGPSGSGKSTLLGLLAGLDRPTRGRVVLDGRDLATLSEDERARVRAEAVGFVFQSFHLIPTLTARENIQVPLELRGEDGRARSEELLERVGLRDRGHHYPAQLSGGEQQRVAVARAFANRPRILFADEPTGNLDAANGQNVIALLVELNRELGTTLVLVTHDPDLARLARRVIRLRDGSVVEDAAVLLAQA
jgi:putative ABC transport system ATP-binding protein